MKKQILLIPLFLFVFATIGLAWTVTLEAPANSENVSGEYDLNATFADYGGTLPNQTWCSFYAKSSLTANSTYTVGTTTGLLANVTNQTVNGLGVAWINTSFNSESTMWVIEDASNYEFAAYCGVDNTTITTTLRDDDTSTSVIVNTSIPDTPSSLVPAADSILNYTGITFSAAVGDANTTACTLYFTGNNPGTTSYTGTHTSGTTTCTKSFSTTYIAEGVYTYYIQASDGAETRNSASTTFTIDTPGGSAFTRALIKQLEEENLAREGKTTNWWIIGIIVLFVGYLLLKKKKK